MFEFSANLGFLFKELALPDAVAAAADAGFAGVEFHRPYELIGAAQLHDACARSGVIPVTLNTSLGNNAAGERGLCALPGREPDARGDIDRAVKYAAELGARGVNVLAGVHGDLETYERNLRHATLSAHDHGVMVLIEPQNAHDHPGYTLTSMNQAIAVQDRIAAPNLKVLFDCYHVWREGNDPINQIFRLTNRIGHVQIAGVPGRNEPDEGELELGDILDALISSGYSGLIGAEYRPRSSDTIAGLGWLKRHKRRCRRRRKFVSRALPFQT